MPIPFPSIRSAAGPSPAELARALAPFAGESPASSSAPFTATVVELAQTLHNGQGCAFALHDALLETGHADLAEHFHDGQQSHGKGCWALALILRKP